MSREKEENEDALARGGGKQHPAWGADQRANRLPLRHRGSNPVRHVGHGTTRDEVQRRSPRSQSEASLGETLRKPNGTPPNSVAHEHRNVRFVETHHRLLFGGRDDRLHPLMQSHSAVPHRESDHGPRQPQPHGAAQKERNHGEEHMRPNAAGEPGGDTQPKRGLSRRGVEFLQMSDPQQQGRGETGHVGQNFGARQPKTGSHDHYERLNVGNDVRSPHPSKQSRQQHGGDSGGRDRKERQCRFRRREQSGQHLSGEDVDRIAGWMRTMFGDVESFDPRDEETGVMVVQRT